MFIHNRGLEVGFPRKPCLGLGGKVGEVSHRRWSHQGLHGKEMANQVREQAVPRRAGKRDRVGVGPGSLEGAEVPGEDSGPAE